MKKEVEQVKELKKYTRRGIGLLAALALACAGGTSTGAHGVAVAESAVFETAGAEAASSGTGSVATVEERGLDLGDSSVRYPVVTGIGDEALEKKINDQILQDCKILDYLARMSMLISGGSIHVEWEGGVLGDLFTCVVSASGQVENSRKTHVWTASNIDLRTGEPIGWDQLFTDGARAGEIAERYLAGRVAPEMSAHLLNSELTPIPEIFRVEKAGLTLLYPVDQLSTLSGRAGAVRIGWHELRDVLNLEADSVPDRAGVAGMIHLTEESAKSLRRMAAEGCVEGIPARIGDSLRFWTDRAHLLIDPDIFRDGRLFSLEGASFRDVFLITDALGEDWEDSVVEGIRVDQGCVYGLCPGETARDAWRAVLGDPDYAVEIDPDTAEAYRIIPGTCDYYACGDHQLQLYADENGILSSLILK